MSFLPFTVGSLSGFGGVCLFGLKQSPASYVHPCGDILTLKK